MNSAYGKDSGYDCKSSILFADPLAFIDPKVNLDSVLKIKRIGDSMKMLCKSIPGQLC